MSRRKVLLGFAAFLTMAGVIGAACGTDAQRPTEAPAPAPGAVDAQGRVIVGVAEEAPGEPAAADTVLEGVGLPLQLSAVGPKIVKNATLSIEVRRDGFDQQFQEAMLIASRHGGFVASSQVEDQKRKTGLIVLRVPADEFEGAVAELKRLGTVNREGLHGEDVTPQFVDLEARLRNWETQEGVLLRLLAEARSVEDSIKVQRVLQDVQLAIEEIRGQLRVLENQASLATISVSITEAGFVPPEPKDENTLLRAWKNALQGFLAVIAAVLVGLGYLVPIALIGLAAFGGWWMYRRTRARPVATP